MLDEVKTQPYICDESEKLGVLLRVVAGRGTVVDSPNIPIVRDSLSERRYLGDDSPPLLCCR